jgi:hypothetical protein
MERVHRHQESSSDESKPSKNAIVSASCTSIRPRPRRKDARASASRSDRSLAHPRFRHMTKLAYRASPEITVHAAASAASNVADGRFPSATLPGGNYDGIRVGDQRPTEPRSRVATYARNCPVPWLGSCPHVVREPDCVTPRDGCAGQGRGHAGGPSPIASAVAPVAAGPPLIPQNGDVSPNRRKFRQARTWSHLGKFPYSGQIRKDRTPPQASRRVPDHQITPRQPSKTGKFPLAGRPADPHPACRRYPRHGLSV